MFVILDAHADGRFADNPLVTGSPHIRFYVGVPLRSPSAYDVGTLCIIDRQPRTGFSEADRATLRMLATLVLEKLELRRLEVAHAQGQSQFENIAALRPTALSAPITRGGSPSGTPRPSSCSATLPPRRPGEHRPDHPTRGLLSPHAFLADLETSTVADEVGALIIRTAVAQAAAWRRRWPEFTMAINLFGAQFREGHLATQVLASLQRHGLPPRALELEITENIILRHDETMMVPLGRLRDEGVRIAFDDFGTGYASLSMLKRYPLTKLKIDRSFTLDLDGGEIGGAIVNAIISMARSLSLDVIAEGVETRWQAGLLRAAGCDLAQGYLYGAPEDVGAFERHQSVRVGPLAA